MRKLFISLFSGAGGLDQGFIDAGWEPAFMVDSWQPAIDTLTANHHDTPVYGWDLSDPTDSFLDWALDNLCLKGTRDHVLCIAGGPPCQALSRLNNNQLFDDSRETERNLNDPRRSLFMSFLRIVRKIKPPFVVMENVADLKTRKLGGTGADKNRPIINVILEEFDAAGYHVSVEVLRAQDFNVPQMRKRIIFVGTRKDLSLVPSLPTPMPLVTSVATEFARIRPEHPNQDMKVHTDAWINKIRHIPQGGYYNHLPLEYKVLKPVDGSKVAAKIIGQPMIQVANGHCLRATNGTYYVGDVWAPLAAGAEYFQVMPRMGTYLRRIKETVSHTVTRNPLIHPTENRDITVREKAAIQTFPPEYQFVGRIQEQHVLVGNAVPCNLGKAIAEHVWRLYG
jgi:DNA (cytosine-5)-methyltransferase 1